MLGVLWGPKGGITTLFGHFLSHVSKGTSELKQNETQETSPFSGIVFLPLYVCIEFLGGNEGAQVVQKLRKDTNSRRNYEKRWTSKCNPFVSMQGRV